MVFRALLLVLPVACMAAGAHAARITNLDTVSHTVTFSHAGDVLAQEVAPNKTVYFPRLDGVVSLKGGRPAKDVVNSDGLLRGVIGAARTSNIPAGPADDFVIWEGGQLRLQRRVKGMMGN